jgi:thymidylate synthase
MSIKPTHSSASEQVFRSLYSDILNNGKLCSPRGQKVIELEHYTYQLPPYVRFASFESRKMKSDYLRREFLWYLRGNRRDISITKHAKIWGDVMNEDGTINSNYGQYIFNSAYEMSQFEYVVGELKKDPDSRRAAITILNATHTAMITKDVPCTYSLNFRIRDSKLNMSVHMRSQDAVFGLGNDAPTFSFIHEMVFEAVKMYGAALELGTYTHTADSLHVYERHFNLLEEIAAGDAYIPMECPRINGIEEVRHLIYGIHARYKLGRAAWCYDRVTQDNAAHGTKRLRFEDIETNTFEHLAFSNWLLEPDLADEALFAAETLQLAKKESSIVPNYSSPPVYNSPT